MFVCVGATRRRPPLARLGWDLASSLLVDRHLSVCLSSRRRRLFLTFDRILSSFPPSAPSTRSPAAAPSCIVCDPSHHPLTNAGLRSHVFEELGCVLHSAERHRERDL
jgi:hypothetical protein